MASSTDSVHFIINPSTTPPSAAHHLIYFITGNPGLIGYYETFLDSLCRLLNSSQGNKNIYHIYGRSLSGFVDSDLGIRKTPYGLEEQINISLSNLKSQCLPSERYSEPEQYYHSVILVGHSVGSYILLELIERLGKSSPINISAGILLFPTVTHIAQSSSGGKISALFRIPNFAKKMGIVAIALVYLAPECALKWLVGIVAKMPREAAEVTTRFLKSRMGVWQALHMAKDEMDFITEDKWGEGIWGFEHEDLSSESQAPKLIFYFGKNDHWVADHTRDALIAARGRENEDKGSSKPVMMIDQSGIPHGFCIHKKANFQIDHSEIVAEKVAVWIKALMTDILVACTEWQIKSSGLLALMVEDIVSHPKWKNSYKKKG
ncbi:uncharacterized protein RAG0_10364 [Rhynchosporium agropyri]|uniref:Lipid droplet-associated hydrolase n=1 Tax=Rhynchosporium agropyri TaxID=914238 RepID=A0A1E1KZI3_9HELO|nr:uncharacterized protein RAG0_10364 [Rhynchosporium agropyri]